MFWFSENLGREGGEVSHKHPKLGCLMDSSFSQLPLPLYPLCNSKKAWVGRHLRALIDPPHTPAMFSRWSPHWGVPCFAHSDKAGSGHSWRFPGFPGSEPSTVSQSRGHCLCPSQVPSHLPHFLFVYRLYLGPDFLFWWSDCEGILYDLHETICGSYSVSSTVLESPHLGWANTVLGLLKRLTSRDRIKPKGWGECHFDEAVIQDLPVPFLTQPGSDVSVQWTAAPPHRLPGDVPTKACLSSLPSSTIARRSRLYNSRVLLIIQPKL